MNKDLIDELNKPEMEKRRKRFQETFNEWVPFHYDCFETLEDYIKYLEESVSAGAKQEKYLRRNMWDRDSIRSAQEKNKR